MAYQVGAAMLCCADAAMTDAMTGSSTLAKGSATADDHYNGWLLEVTDRPASATGNMTAITDYDGLTKVVSPAIVGSTSGTTYAISAYASGTMSSANSLRSTTAGVMTGLSTLDASDVSNNLHDSAASAADGTYNGWTLTVVAGPGTVGQNTTITSYTGSSRLVSPTIGGSEQGTQYRLEPPASQPALSDENDAYNDWILEVTGGWLGVNVTAGATYQITDYIGATGVISPTVLGLGAGTKYTITGVAAPASGFECGPADLRVAVPHGKHCKVKAAPNYTCGDPGTCYKGAWLAGGAAHQQLACKAGNRSRRLATCRPLFR